MATTAQIAMKTEQVLRVMRTAGFKTSAQQASAIGVDASTWSRLINGQHSPSQKVIAGVLHAFPAWPFDELFLITDAESFDEVAEVA